MTDSERKAEKALREGISEALKVGDKGTVSSMLQSLTYEVEDGEFQTEMKWSDQPESTDNRS